MASNNDVTPDVSSAFGTADGTVADVGGSFNQGTLNNNFRDVVEAINASRVVGMEVGAAGAPYLVVRLTVDAGSGSGAMAAGTYEARIPVVNWKKV